VCGDMSKRHYYRTHAFGVCPAARDALSTEQGDQMARPGDPSLPGCGDIDPDCGSVGDRDGLSPAPAAAASDHGLRSDSPLSAANCHSAESVYNVYAYRRNTCAR
jgi:hypothetical protein